MSEKQPSKEKGWCRGWHELHKDGQNIPGGLVHTRMAQSANEENGEDMKFFKTNTASAVLLFEF